MELYLNNMIHIDYLIPAIGQLGLPSISIFQNATERNQITHLRDILKSMKVFGLLEKKMSQLYKLIESRVLIPLLDPRRCWKMVTESVQKSVNLRNNNEPKEVIEMNGFVARFLQEGVLVCNTGSPTLQKADFEDIVKRLQILEEATLFLSRYLFMRTNKDEEEDLHTTERLLGSVGLWIWEYVGVTFRDTFLKSALPKEADQLLRFARLLLPPVKQTQATILRALALVTDTTVIITSNTQSTGTHSNSNSGSVCGYWTQFLENIDEHFAGQKSLHTLEEGRSFLVHDDYFLSETHQVCFPLFSLTSTITDSSPSSVSTTNNTTTNTTTTNTNNNSSSWQVSGSVFRTVEVAMRVMGELAAWELSEQGRALVWSSVVELLSLYLFLIPTARRQKIETVPQLGMLVFNDCLYLQHVLRVHVIPRMYHLQTQHVMQTSVEATSWVTRLRIQVLSLIGELEVQVRHQLRQQLWKQTELIHHTLEAAQNLHDTHIDSRFKTVKLAFEQLINNLTQVAKVWRELVPALFYQELIASLIAEAFRQVLEHVFQLTDLATEETERLGKQLLPSLLRLEGLLQIPLPPTLAAPSPTQLISVWNKYIKTMELLTLPLKNIEGSIDAGAYRNLFSSSELSQMIRAIFSDSPNRARVLLKLQ